MQGLFRSAGVIGVFVAGIYVASHVDTDTLGGQFAALLAGAFAFLSPIGLYAFFEMVDHRREAEQRALEHAKRQALLKRAQEMREGIRGAFEEAAKWRRREAKENSDDKRNLEAAAVFDRLAASVTDVDVGLLDGLQRTLFDNDGFLPDVLLHDLVGVFGGVDDAVAPDSDHHWLKKVGFVFWPTDATDFARRYAEKIQA